MAAVRRVTMLTVGAVLLVGACGGDDDTGDPAGGATTTVAEEPTASATSDPNTTTTVAATTTGGGACPTGESTEPVVGGDADMPGTLSDVTVAAAGPCGDEITFTFQGAVPGYRVEYQPGPFTEDGSGEPATVAGSAFVVVRFEPAYTFDFDAGQAVYEGPRQLTPADTNVVQEVENTGDFEAVLTWVIGVRDPVPVAATTAGTTLTIMVG